MLLDRLDPATGLPCVRESRVAGGALKTLPKWLLHLAGPAFTDAAPWFPNYLTWEGPTLTRIRCWKCGIDLCGWRPVLDRHGNVVRRDGHLCLWLRMYDHARQTPVVARWGCLDRLVGFEALHCADCQLTAADVPMLMAILLSGYTTMLTHAHDEGIAIPFDQDTWATYCYRWSDAPHIRCEPVGVGEDVTKETLMHLPTPGKPMTPADYLHWGELLQAQQFWPGMVMEFTGSMIPPGWMHGPREGTIVKL